MRGSPDARFFETMAPVSLADLAELTGARLLQGDARATVARVAPLGFAGGDAVAFLGDRKHAAALAESEAGACFVTEALAVHANTACAVLVTPTPHAAYVAAANRLHRPRAHPVGAPAVHPDVTLEDGAVLAAGVTVGPGASIGRGSHICAGASIGDRVRIYAGAIVGEAGFGATAGSTGVVDVPQLGRVILQDGVTLGANSCVDRGAYDDTVIGENTKIDNLVQIAHNVVIGRNCVFAAHCGISGSVTIGDGCMFGGRVGVADHLTIGAGARVAAASGVAKNIPAGESWGGTPARPIRQWIRETAWTAAMAQRRVGRGVDE